MVAHYEVGRARWEDGKFEASLGYIVKPWLKKPKPKNTHRRT